MKHLLNDMTQEEITSILEQHSGGIKLTNENFSKLINKRLGDVPSFLNEDEIDIEDIDVFSPETNNLGRPLSDSLSEISRMLYKHEDTVLDYQKINDLINGIERILSNKLGIEKNLD